MNARAITTGGFVAHVPSWSDTFAAAARAVQEWRERARSRRALADLDARLLKDIGLTRHDAGVEVRKPFWVG